MITLTNVSKVFDVEGRKINALAPTDLHVSKGEIMGLVGFSGAGKSTLLRAINLLGRPTTGTVEVGGSELTSMSSSELREVRGKIGIIFQAFNLLSARTAADNVAFPLELQGLDKEERRERAITALEKVGLGDAADQYPAQLSGGMRQRVAIARALASEPHVLLSDEATSALDPHTTLTILELLKELRDDLGLTVVVVTHEINVVDYLCDRVAIMERGAVIEELDLRQGPPQPQTALGRFLSDSANGWDENSVSLAAQVLEATT